MANGDVQKVVTAPPQGPRAGQTSRLTLSATGAKSKVVTDVKGQRLSSVTVSAKINPMTHRPDVTLFKRDASGNGVTTHPNGGKTIVSQDGRTVTHVRVNGTTIVNNKTIINNTSYTINRTRTVGGQSFHEAFSYRREFHEGWRFPFYGWAPEWALISLTPFLFDPWLNPFFYSWNLDPWYATYYPWFRPYHSYRGPRYWIADWVMMDFLRDNYEEHYEQQAQIDADVIAEQDRAIADLQQTEQDLQTGDDQIQQPPPEVPVVLDDATKDQLADQAQDVMDGAKEQTTPTIDQIDTSKEIFVVNDQISATDQNSGSACTLSQGDMLKIVSLSPEQPGALMQVVMSRGDSACAANTQVEVSQQDLQGMLDEYSQRVVNGMVQLNNNKSNLGPNQAALLGN